MTGLFAPLQSRRRHPPGCWLLLSAPRGRQRVSLVRAEEMKKQYFFLFVLAALVVVGGLAYARLSPGTIDPPSFPDPVENQAKPPEARILLASYVNHFDNLQTMTADSDLVVKAAVLHAQPIRIVGETAPTSKQKQLGVTTGVVFTDYLLRVEQVLKGQPPDNGTIVVVQTGGIYNGVTEFIEDDPLFEIGERDILFLRDISNDPIQAPGERKYIINGTPQARFKITNGQISPMIPEEAFVGKFKGMREADFLKAIQAAKSVP